MGNRIVDEQDEQQLVFGRWKFVSLSTSLSRDVVSSRAGCAVVMVRADVSRQLELPVVPFCRFLLLSSTRLERNKRRRNKISSACDPDRKCFFS